MIESVIICRHGNLGFSASLRFTDKERNVDISANNKYSLYKNIDYILRKDIKKLRKEKVNK